MDTPNLSKFFLAYVRGEQHELPKGCVCFVRRGLLEDEDTGILCCMPLVLACTEDAIVLYHYTDRAAFYNIIASKEVYASLLRNNATHTNFGDGVYATFKSPQEFGSKDEVLINNYTDFVERSSQLEQIKPWKQKGASDYCIPLVVKISDARNVMKEGFRAGDREIAPGHNRHGEKVRSDRDIWVIELRNDGQVSNAQESLDDLERRLAQAGGYLKHDILDSIGVHAHRGNAYQAVKLLLDCSTSDHSPATKDLASEHVQRLAPAGRRGEEGEDVFRSVAKYLEDHSVNALDHFVGLSWSGFMLRNGSGQVVYADPSWEACVAHPGSHIDVVSAHRTFTAAYVGEGKYVITLSNHMQMYATKDHWVRFALDGDGDNVEESFREWEFIAVNNNAYALQLDGFQLYSDCSGKLGVARQEERTSTDKSMDQQALLCNCRLSL